MSTEVKGHKTTKLGQVKEHLLKHGSITPLQAISLYSYTRLSDAIYTLRNNGWDITTEDVHITDRNGNSCVYAKYLFVSNGETSAIQNSLDAHLSSKPTGETIEKPHRYISREKTSADHATAILKQAEIFAK